MPQAGFDPPSAEVQTPTECKFDAFTLQATMAGFLLKLIDTKTVKIVMDFVDNNLKNLLSGISGYTREAHQFCLLLQFHHCFDLRGKQQIKQCNREPLT